MALLFGQDFLDAVHRVVEEDDHRLGAVPAHRTELVGCQLMGTVPGHQDGAPGRVGHGGAERGGSGPSDRSPQGLIVKDRALGERDPCHVVHAQAGLGDDDVVLAQEPGQPGIERGRGDRVRGGAGKRGRRSQGDLRCRGPGQRLGQAFQDVGQVHRTERGGADLHVVGPHGDHSARVERVRPDAGVEVGEGDTAEVQDQSGSLDGLLDARARKRSGIAAEESRLRLGDLGLVHRRGGVGQAGGVEEPDQLLLKAEAADRVRGQHDRRLRRRHTPGDGRDRRVETGGIARRARYLGQGHAGDRRADDRERRAVLRRRDVGGPPLRQRLGDHSFHLRDGIERGEVRDHARRCRRQGLELPEHPVAQRVVGYGPGTLQLAARLSDQVEDRQPLGVRAHHAVQGAQLSDGVGRGQDRRSPDTGVTVRRVGRVELVGITDPGDTPTRLDGLVERERVVAGNAEDVLDAQGGQALDRVLRHGHRPSPLRRRRIDCGGLPLRQGLPPAGGRR